MESSSQPKVAYEFLPFLKVYEDGTVERFIGTTTVPPSLHNHPLTKSKDVIFSPELNLSARLYLPKSVTPDQKIPLLLYFHGGGFIIESTSSPIYHNYLNELAAEANVVIVSVDYRLAPEHVLPAAYDDAWTALKWVANGGDDWLSHYADLDKVFIAGESAGGNVAHNLSVRIGTEKVDGVGVVGTVLVHPFFMGKEVVEGENDEMRALGEGMWKLANSNSVGLDHPWINPGCDSNLSKVGCRKLLVCVAEKDALAKSDWDYYERLRSSGWVGNVEIFESKDEDHVFHLLMKPDCQNAKLLMQKLVSFVNSD